MSRTAAAIVSRWYPEDSATADSVWRPRLADDRPISRRILLPHASTVLPSPLAVLATGSVPHFERSRTSSALVQRLPNYDRLSMRKLTVTAAVAAALPVMTRSLPLHTAVSTDVSVASTVFSVTKTGLPP